MPLLLSGSLTVGRKFILPACRKNLRGQPTLFSFAITEPSGGSDVEDSDGARHYIPRTLASRVEGGWRLNGRKVFISGGDRADFITVFAALAGEGMESWTCFLLEGNNPGLTIGRNELKMGQRASAATELIFEDAIVPDSHVIGGLRRGWAINRAVLNFSRIPVGAIALGIARGAAERATEFACQTKLGGKRLIDYQDIQLEVAQMLLDTSAMRAMVWQSAATWTPTQARASMTKVFCADMAMQTCQRAMNLMGNQGCLQENGAEKAYRDARLTQIYEGTNQINRLSVIEDQLEALELLMAGRG
jgi:alkylation response protein AidB-like acyl-CoA dehydrogenase